MYPTVYAELTEFGVLPNSDCAADCVRVTSLADVPAATLVTPLLMAPAKGKFPSNGTTAMDAPALDWVIVELKSPLLSTLAPEVVTVYTLDQLLNLPTLST